MKYTAQALEAMIDRIDDDAPLFFEALAYGLTVIKAEHVAAEMFACLGPTSKQMIANAIEQYAIKLLDDMRESRRS